MIRGGTRGPDEGAAARADDAPHVSHVAGEAAPSLPRGRTRRHLGLAARVTTTFALGALVLSGTLASITYFSVRSSLINQEETSLAHEAVATAEALQGQSEAGQSVVFALAEINGNAASILEQAGQWYPSSQSVQESSVPAGLRSLVLNNHLGEQLVDLAGKPVLIVGVPFRAAGGPVAYFQLFDMSEVAGTLRTLLGALVLASVVTTLGGAVVGRWGARRALRPLRETAQAALSIAGGQLDTRLASDAYSDLAVLTSAFNKMADRLQERIERDARFTSDVNHELRSPLTTVATALSVLEGRRAELPERAAQALDLLSAEVRRFRRLVDDLLEISRLDAGLGDVNAEEVTLGPLMKYTLAAARYQGIIDIPASVGERRVLVDKLRFERVLANLIENADRYAGGPVRVAAEADGAWARIAVEDRGPGVPAEERERIFDRFSRGASGRRRGAGDGTGLGLAIVAEHARLLGGRVWVEPNGSRGARFVVELPVQPPVGPESDEPAAGSAAAQPPSAKSAVPLKSPTHGRRPSTAPAAPSTGASRVVQPPGAVTTAEPPASEP
ncbi:MAG: ATP-binding protein [Acidimicrobiales bacterium]